MIADARRTLLIGAGEKIKNIQMRTNARDYVDIHAFLTKGITLEEALGVARALDPNFNPVVSLKALSYFENEMHVPQNIQIDLQSAAARVRGMTQFAKSDISPLSDQD
jgi:hypothetical protein